jgi:hypothetical protein
MTTMTHEERAADAAVAGGWVLWISSHAMQWMPVVQFISLLAAIAASIAATIYYLKRAGK